MGILVPVLVCCIIISLMQMHNYVCVYAGGLSVAAILAIILAEIIVAGVLIIGMSYTACA